MLLLILQRYYFESESQLWRRGSRNQESCCLSYKDTILKANHSMIISLFHTILAVAYPTKILFWKRITAVTRRSPVQVCCCLSYKDTILKANHSTFHWLKKLRAAVAYPTKILFWKRITAASSILSMWSGCCLSYKDTILKANHSGYLIPYSVEKAVAYPTKILFWKRITARFHYNLLFFCCCLSYKDTILKANHSYYVRYCYLYRAVAYPTKILFWKRITALYVIYKQTNSCCLSYKDTILKANHSTKSSLDCQYIAVAYPTKILFWKRITAHLFFVHIKNSLLLILQRYYFESESQRVLLIEFIDFCCCLSYKDTILKANHSAPGSPLPASLAVAYPTKILFWKRITAGRYVDDFYIVLLLILQRYYFESESQPIHSRMQEVGCCCLSYKDTILKANHSSTNTSCSATFAVAYPTKILFWKRITAQHDIDNMALMLLLILQRYYFESESQRRR